VSVLELAFNIRMLLKFWFTFPELNDDIVSIWAILIAELPSILPCSSDVRSVDADPEPLIIIINNYIYIKKNLKLPVDDFLKRFLLADGDIVPGEGVLRDCWIW